MGHEFRTPNVDDVPELAKAMQATFSDYLVPMHIDEDGLREFISTFDIDLGKSIMVVDGSGVIIGQSFSGIRNEQAWLSGTGLSSDSRKKGIAMEIVKRQLRVLKEARMIEVLLEVIVENVEAKRIFEANGFRKRRDLYSFRNMEPTVGKWPPPDHLRFEPCNITEVLDLYRPDNPWQKMKESIRNMEGCKAFLSFLTQDGGPTRAEGLQSFSSDPFSDLHDQDLPELPEVEETDDLLKLGGPELEGYCVYKETEKGISVLDLYSMANARELLRHLISITGKRPIVTMNVFDAPAVMAFETLGFQLTVTQHEMRLNL